MPKILLTGVDDARVVASTSRRAGEIETRAVIERDDAPIHLHHHRLEPGSSLYVQAADGDRLLCVWHGAVEAAGDRLAEGASAVVEYGASLIVKAGQDGARLLDFNLRKRPADGGVGGHVHLLPSDRVARIKGINQGKRMEMTLHADARCPSYKLWLHGAEYFDAGIETFLHHHSEDEVIFVTGGTLRIGGREYGPGTALTVAAKTRYGFFTGEDGLRFINFRGASPTYVSADGLVTCDESDNWYQVMKGPQPGWRTYAPGI